MGRPSKVIVRDRGLAALLRQAARMKDVRVKVGVLASTPPRESEDDPSMVVVATANEFGTDRIPERSFIRSTVESRKADIDQLLAAVGERVAGLKLTPERGMEIVGQRVRDMIRKRIVDLDTPPNAPITIERKGSSNPLIDTGQLRQAISYEVVGKGEVDS